jgi:hypothetical protein
MRRGWCSSVLFCLFVTAGASSLGAQTAFNFEGLPDSAPLTGQYSGATFANTIVLSTGITLDEFEYPAHSGSNVASDNGGPIAISFTWPVEGLIGYFTYSVPLTIQALDSSNHPIASTVSTYSNNEALSGASGSQPNQMLTVTSSSGIYKIVITGATGGTSFTVDDIGLVTKCDLNQPGTVNAADAQAILNQALGGRSPVTDLNNDGVVNVVDVETVIGAALGLGCATK